MAQKYLYTFRDGERIYFSKGRFDEWCVYRAVPNEAPEPPRDVDYFTALQAFGTNYGPEQIYANFLSIYDLTDKTPKWKVFALIAEQGKKLRQEHYLDYCKLMVTLYYAMIAEENREPPDRFPLKKRVKKIGVYQVLIAGSTPSAAANFSKRKRAKDLLKLLAEYEAWEKSPAEN